MHLNYWSEIYQKHGNNISQVWSNERKAIYEQERNNENVRVEFNRVVTEENRRINDNSNRLLRIAGLGGVVGGGRLISREENMNYIEVPFSLLDHYDAVAMNNPSAEYVSKMYDFVITMDDLKTQIKKIKCGKQPGPDKLKGEIYKWLLGSEICLQKFTTALNSVHMRQWA